MTDINVLYRLIGGAHAASITFVAISIMTLALAIFWVYQFVQLMLLEDRWFPGRFDKALWVGVFVLIFPLAPFAFLMWKAGRRAEASKNKQP